MNRCCRYARQIADDLQKAGVEVLNDVVLNQVVVAFGDDDRPRRVIDLVQDGGTCWCGGTTWRDRAAMRISFGSWATNEDDITRPIAAILADYRRTQPANSGCARAPRRCRRLPWRSTAWRHRLPASAVFCGLAQPRDVRLMASGDVSLAIRRQTKVTESATSIQGP